jgi:hypothetical protein
MKATLKNTTVKYTSKRNLFVVFKGKGTGSQIASFATMDEAVKFDSDFNKIEYKSIVQKSTNKKGGAYFYKNTTTMFDKNHPYFNDFKIA